MYKLTLSSIKFSIFIKIDKNNVLSIRYIYLYGLYKLCFDFNQNIYLNKVISDYFLVHL